jgi:predicted amidohydrolase
MFRKHLMKKAKRKYTQENIRNLLVNYGVHGFSSPVDVDVNNPVVAAVSAQYRIYDNLTEYALAVNSMINRAASRQASLVVLPEFFQIQALSLIPYYYDAIKPQKDGTKPTVFEIIRRLDDEQLEMLNGLTIDLLKELARIYKLYIVAGANLMRRGEKTLLRAYTIDDKGEIIGHQDKLFETSDCEGENLTYGEGISVMETDIGHLCVLIGGDCGQWQAYKSAVEAGADIIAAPVALRYTHNPYLAMRDIQSNVQFYYAFAIKSCFIGGDEIGLHFSGKSLITAPYKMTECKNGILAVATSPEKNEVVTAHLNMNALKTYYDSYIGR